MSEHRGIVELIRNSQKFLVASHENPDADAIGSMLAMGLALLLMDKDVYLYNKDGVPKVLSFLPGSDLIKSSIDKVTNDFDCTLIVDCTDPSRVGVDILSLIDSGRCGKVVIIDHHKTNKISSDSCLLNPDSPSTGIIIYSLIKELHVNIDTGIAINLYATILGDTGSFRYSNTSPEAFRVAAELVEHGANPSEISQALYESETEERLRLISLALSTLEISKDGRIASVVLNKEMYSMTGTTREDTDGIVNLPRSIKGIEVAILFNELERINVNESRWKISLRSKGYIDVSRVAELFCGGGHERAAGCTIKGSLNEVKQKLFSVLNKIYT